MISKHLTIPVPDSPIGDSKIDLPYIFDMSFIFDDVNLQSYTKQF